MGAGPFGDALAKFLAVAAQETRGGGSCGMLLLVGKQTPQIAIIVLVPLGDVVGVQSRSLGWPLKSAIERIAKEKAGVVVVLREQESSRDFMDAVEGVSQSTDELTDRRDGDAVIRTYGVGAQILRDLGLSKIRVLSAPKQMHAISGFDLEITEYVED